MAKANLAPAPPAAQPRSLAELLQEAQELEALLLALEGLRCGELALRPGLDVPDFTRAEGDGRLADLQRVLGAEAATRAVRLRRALEGGQPAKDAGA
jgi:hypothetical protein